MKIAIDGNIGVGKTTLLENLKKKIGDDDCEIYKEEINRKVLTKFYKYQESNDVEKKRKFELLSQLYFLLLTIIREMLSYDDDKEIKIYDRSLAAHLHIFSKLNLDSVSYFLYSGFQELTKRIFDIEKYDLQIILTCDLTTNHERILKRNRNMEQTIPLEYLSKLEEMHKSDEYKEISEDGYSDIVIYFDVSDKDADKVCEDIYKIIMKFNEYI